MCFINPEEGYAVGAAGTLIHYKNKKWEPMEVPTHRFLYIVAYENPLGIMVAGRDKVIFNNPKAAE
jgi:hypothetical protein